MHLVDPCGNGPTHIINRSESELAGICEALTHVGLKRSDASQLESADKYQHIHSQTTNPAYECAEASAWSARSALTSFLHFSHPSRYMSSYQNIMRVLEELSACICLEVAAGTGPHPEPVARTVRQSPADGCGRIRKGEALAAHDLPGVWPHAEVTGILFRNC